MDSEELENIELIDNPNEEQQSLFNDLPEPLTTNNKKTKNKKNKKRKENKYVENKQGSEWFHLDNAATIYPAVVDKQWMFVYRISAIMKVDVNPEYLQKALDDILPRFPTFNVSIRRGLFWYYFEGRNKSINIEKEHTFPCQPFEFGSGKKLIRVLYYNNRISFECFHALADGRGSLLLFNTLIRRYLEIFGAKITGYEGCLNYKDFPQAEETEDAFFQYCTEGAKNKLKEKKAFKIKGTMEYSGVINTTNAVMNINNLKKVAKSFDAGIYVYLCAVTAYSIYKRNKQAKKPIKISVPIDLRTFFDSPTLRNFSSYINVEVPTKNKELEFEDVINIFKEEFKKINKDFLLKNINANTGLQKNIFIKIQPLFIKNIVMRICFKALGEDFQTLAFSNIGKVQTPPEFENFIERYEVNLGRNKYNNKSMGVVTFGETVVLTISSKIKENTFERDFVRMLAKHGVEIKVESNRRDLYAR